MLFIHGILAFVAAIVYAELIGYWVHILLHSERFPSLSRAHMLHHLRDYGPHKKLRTEDYINSSEGRASFLGGIGMEWFIPLSTVVVVTVGGLWLFKTPLFISLVFIVVGITWGYIGFSYMHSAMHLKNFWMLKNSWLRHWFLNVRRVHDIHHNNVSPDGRMQTNYGICFFWFDRLFQSYSRRVLPHAKQGFEQAYKRYAYITNPK